MHLFPFRCTLYILFFLKNFLKIPVWISIEIIAPDIQRVWHNSLSSNKKLETIGWDSSSKKKSNELDITDSFIKIFPSLIACDTNTMQRKYDVIVNIWFWQSRYISSGFFFAIPLLVNVFYFCSVPWTINDILSTEFFLTKSRNFTDR